MKAGEAREVRSRIAEALDPLYEARIGNAIPLKALELAIARLHTFDVEMLNHLRDIDHNEDITYRRSTDHATHYHGRSTE